MGRRSRKRENADLDWQDEPRGADESEPLMLDEVLEPYDGASEEYEGGEPVYQDMYLGYDDYDDGLYEQEEETAGRFNVAMSIFNVISVLVGILLILLLVGLLVSLLNWLDADIRHSFVLLQSNLQ